MEQFEINGQQFNVVDKRIYVDRVTLKNVTLNQIPVGMEVMSYQYPEDIADVIGLRNLGDGQAEVFICNVLYVDESIVSEEAYKQAMVTLLGRREEQVGDVRDIEGNYRLDGQYSWFAVKSQADTTEAMFKRARKVGEEFNQQLEELANAVQTLVDSVGKIQA